jgi:hypothetical protein
MKIRDKDGVETDLSTLTMEQLQELRIRKLEDIDDIKGQIEAAKARRVTEGEWADPVWFHKANRAKLYKARDLDKIKHMITRLKRERRESIESLFVSVAKERLTPVAWQTIWDEAHDHYHNRNSNVQGGNDKRSSVPLSLHRIPETEVQTDDPGP